MRGGQQFAVRHRLAIALDIRRAADDRRALQQPLHRRHFDELARRRLVIGQRRMRRGAARKGAPIVAAGRGHAAIDDDAARPGRQFERQAAGMRVLADIRRRRRAGVDDDGRRAGIEALKAGMRHVRHRRAVGVVIGEQRRHQIGRRAAHAVEQRETAVAVAEEAQHRHHAVDRVEQRRRRRDVARGKGLPQRQQVAAAVRPARRDCARCARRRAGSAAAIRRTAGASRSGCAAPGWPGTARRSTARSAPAAAARRRRCRASV